MTLVDVERFAARYLKIRDKRGRIRPLIPNSVQRRYIAAKAAARVSGGSLRTLVLKSRRGGITTWEQAESYALTSLLLHQRAITLAHDLESTVEIFDISKAFWREGFGVARPALSRSNRRELIFHGGASRFFVGTAGATGVGRGATLSRVHGSEVAKWPGTIEEQRDVLAGLSEACSHGEVVLESTANGAAGLFYELSMEALEGRGPWHLIFIPWWWDDEARVRVGAEELHAIEATLSDAERHLVQAHGLAPAQIAWRRRKVEELGPLFQQEYPEDPVTAFLLSGSCYFDHEVLDRHARGCVEPARERSGAGDLLKWVGPRESGRYIIGADPSEGVAGSDSSAAYVIDVDSGAIVAGAHGLWRPYEFAAVLVRLARAYNSATIAVEVQNHGHAVMGSLTREHGYPMSRIYRRRLYDSVTRRTTEKLGWVTDAVTRPNMLSSLANHLRSESSRVVDAHLIKECRQFLRTKSDRYEAGPGAHDDRIFAMAIALFVRATQPAPARVIAY